MSASDDLEGVNPNNSAQTDAHLSHDDRDDILLATALQPISQWSEDDGDVEPDPSELLEGVVGDRESNPYDKGKQKADDTSGSNVVDRPNRYIGPSSTWKSWIEGERAISDSLIELRNRDLAAHLFNAHSLKVRRRANANANLDSELDPSFQFVPGKSWTAWPMPPSEVPRGTLQPVYDASEKGIYSSYKTQRAAEDLEDSLIARTLCIAKEEFHTRQWDDESDDEKNSAPESRQNVSTENMPADATDALFFSSQAFRDPGSSTNDESGSTTGSVVDPTDYYDDPGSTKVIFTADDEEARRLLLPSVKDTLSRLDSLFGSLHTTRQAYAADTSDAIDDGSTIRTSISRHRERRRSESRRRKSIRTEETTGTEASEEGSRSGSSRRTRGNEQKVGRFGLRDWSDVLAMAAITGWDPNVIQRSASRCAALFSEDMQFRTLYENTPNDSSRPHDTDFTASGGAPIDVHSADVAQNDTDTSGPSRTPEGRYMCPKEGCRLRARSFKTATTLRAHMRRHHEAHPFFPSSSGQELSDGDRPRMDADQNVYCPVQACKTRGTPFSRPTKMYAHLRKFHPDIDVDAVKRAHLERRGENGSRSRRKKRSWSSGSPEGGTSEP